MSNVYSINKYCHTTIFYNNYFSNIKLIKIFTVLSFLVTVEL